MKAWKGRCPPDEKKIWRYIDFAKLISLLHKQSLYFPRADKLGDPYEGSFPKSNVEQRKMAWTIHGGKPLSEVYRLFVKLTVINCWHLNEHESDAMWKIYSKNTEGIAIRSTVGRLKSSLTEKKEKIKIFQVEYTDYDEETIPEGTSSPYFHKRKSFEHEREIRAVMQKIKYKENREIDFDYTPFKDGGIYVSVDLSTLIETIYLSPACPEWQKDAIDSMLEKYSLNKEVRHSKLDESPKY